MASVLKVDKLDPQSGTALEIGTSGDTVSIPSGATLDISASTLTPPATMPASSGVNLTALNATQLTSGTVPAARLSGVGKILQVVQGSKGTQFETSSTSLVAVTSFETAITLSATSSKVLIMASTSAIHIATTSAGGELNIKFYKNHSSISVTAIGAEYQVAKSRQDPSYTQEVGGGGTAMYLDSPSTTEEITYSVYARITNGSAGRICQGGTGGATITLIEVGA